MLKPEEIRVGAIVYYGPRRLKGKIGHVVDKTASVLLDNGSVVHVGPGKLFRAGLKEGERPRLGLAEIKALVGDEFFNRASTKHDVKYSVKNRAEGTYLLIHRRSKGSGNWQLNNYPIYKVNEATRELDFVRHADSFEEGKTWLSSESLVVPAHVPEPWRAGA